MNIRMVTTTAGSAAARYTHQGFPPKGGTNQPLSGLVGYGEKKKKRKKTVKNTGDRLSKPRYHLKKITDLKLLVHCYMTEKQ